MGMCSIMLTFCWLPVVDSMRQQTGPRRVGEIVVVGNEETPDLIIRELLNLYPGQPLNMADVRESEERLIRSGYFVVDSERGIRPRITILEDGGSDYRDIIVAVQDAPGKPWLRNQRIFFLVASVAFILVVLVVIRSVARAMKSASS